MTLLALNDAHQRSYKWHFLLNIEIKVYNDIIYGKAFFDQPVKNDLITYENIRNIATGEEEDYTTGCLIDYNYFKNYCKIIAIDLSKQKALDTDSKLIQQIKFNVFYYWSSKRNLFRFSQGTVTTCKFFLFWYNVNKMTQYNISNVKLSNSQLNKSKSGINNSNEVLFKLSSNVVGDSNDENNFPHKLMLTNTQVSRLRQVLQIIPQLV